MAKYKYDGKYLKLNGRIIANVSGNKIRKGNGGITIANIVGEKVREGTGGKTLINIRGNDIREGNGGHRIAKMDDIRKIINGPGGVTLAALWYFFIR